MPECSTQRELQQSKCVPCEGGVPRYSAQEAKSQIEQLPEWQLNDDATAISRKLKFKNFVDAVAFFNRVADLAETEQHHPDLHVTGYRHLRIDLTTHAIDGLSQNDFVLAAKIDQLQ